MTQHTWQVSPSKTVHCFGYGASRRVVAQSQPACRCALLLLPGSLVRCPLPLKVLTHKAVPLANPVQHPHTRLYLITQIKPWDVMLIMPKAQIWACVGTYDLLFQQSHWKATSYSHLACLIPRGSEAHEEHQYLNKTEERFS